MRVQANLNNVKEIEVLPTGVYSCFIEKEPELTKSSKKGTEGLSMTLILTDPGTEIAPGVPRRMFHTVYKSGEMGWEHFKVKELVEACGIKYDTNGFDTADFVNANLKIAVGQESYTPNEGGEAKIKNVIERFLKA